MADPEPPVGSNLHLISATNKEMSVNFISHLLDSGFDSVLKSLGTYLVLDSLEVLLVTFMGVSNGTKLYKHSDLLNVVNTIVGA